MCGIVGKVNFEREHPVNSRQIQRMTDALRHRGPDDEGVWVEGNVGLGHRRLSIIDLSPSGRNPMSNEDQSIWIVFNGEIYNFRELRAQLEASGHQFRSRTDTEVVAHLYEEQGADCVTQLRGMFAFAIWDQKMQRLLLARDRLGVKPLYYSVDDSRLLFGSEIKALLASEEVETVPDPIGIHQFLLWQSIPSPRTAFRGIRKLPPASVLIWQPDTGVAIQKYWELPERSPLDHEPAVLAEEVRSLVQEATSLRWLADVPVGILLSGGLDSACVLAAARQADAGRIKTFSITFGHRHFDESDYARNLARHFGTEHYEFQITPQVMDLLPEMASLFDEPFADLAAIPTYCLSKLTREHITVALSGDGGDEAFGGYRRYLALQALGYISRLPGNKWLAALSRLLPYHSAERSSLRYFRELLNLAGRPPREQYRTMLLGLMEETQWTSSYTNDFRDSLVEYEREAFLAGWDTPHLADNMARAMASDTLGYIPECLNVKADICSMACGLELRSPFLDHKLVEFCARIPSQWKIRSGKQKYILRRAFEKDLPATVLARGKAGFSLPLADWLRNELKDLAREVLLSPGARIGDWLHREKIRMMLEQHASGQHNWHIQLWRLLVLESWLQAVTKPDVLVRTETLRGVAPGGTTVAHAD